MVQYQPSNENDDIAAVMPAFQVTLGATIAACEKAGEWKAAVHLMATARGWGLEASSLMSQRCGRLSRGLAYLWCIMGIIRVVIHH